MAYNISQNLHEWAADRKGARFEFVRQLADAIDDPRQAGTWSLIDIRSEFAARNGSVASPVWLGAARSALMPFYVVPILITWWHLRNAVSEFSRFSASLPGESEVSFLTFWSGGYANAPDITTLQATAGWVAVVVLVIFLLQFAVTLLEEFMSSPVEPPHDLLLAAQLQLASTRAMTPQEVTEVVSAAAMQLETALQSVQGAVESATNLVTIVGEASNALHKTSSAVEQTALRLEGALEPIGELRNSLADTSTSIVESSRALDAARSQMVEVSRAFAVIADATQNFRDSVGVVRAETERMASAVRNSGDALESVGSRLPQLVSTAERIASAAIDSAGETMKDSLVAAAQNMRESVAGAGEVARHLANLTSGVSQHGPIMKDMREITDRIEMSVNGIRNAVDEVKEAVEAFREVNSLVDEAIQRGLGN